MGFVYWIYFDKVGRPEEIRARNMQDFMRILQQMIERTGEMPEWINRVYK